MAVISNSSSPPLLEIGTPTIWAQSQSKKHQVKFNWSIINFSYRQKKMGTLIKSPIFFATSNEEIKFRLDLYPNGYNEDSKGYLSVYLKLLTEPTDISEVLMKLKICFLNAKDDQKKELKFSEAQHIQLNESRGFFKLMQLAFLMDPSNGFLPEDKLTITSEVTFICDGERDSGNISSFGQFQIPERKITEDFSKLLDNNSFSDVTLVVGEHEFPAHKAILATRSDVFAAMFEHEMKESKLNRVTITDVDHEVLQEMLRFIYTGDAPKLKEIADQVLAAADKYALARLKVMSEEAMFAELSIDTAAETLVLADLYNAVQLKEKTINFINIHATEIIKTNGWQNMKKAHSHLIIETFEALFTPANNENLPTP